MSGAANLSEVETLAQALGEAVSGKDHDRIRALLDPDLDFRGMTPRRVWEAAGPDDVVDAVQAWFGDKDVIESVDSLETDAFADCGRVAYRLRIRNDEGLHLVEQQAYLRHRDGRITRLRIMCSGYRPIDST